MDSEGISARNGGISAALGAVAWVVGYLLTYALEGSTVRNSGAVRVIEAVTGDQVAWKVVGWLFYNAHFVETTVDVPVFGASAVNFIAEGEGATWVLYLVPPLVLLLAGAAATLAGDGESLASGAKRGLLVVPGYFVLAVVGALLFAVGSGDASAAPNLLMAAFLAGLVYPAVFGTVGGAAAAAVTGGESSAPEQTA